MDIVEKINTALNEAGVSLITVADSFARYLIGDKKIAVSELGKAQQLPTPGLKKMSPKEYNDLYQKLHLELHKVIRKHMKDVIMG